MTWLSDFETAQPVAYAVLLMCAVAVAGLGVGHISVRGVRLGVAGVLFAGIAFGHFGLTLQGDTLSLIRDSGLILFVYTIGLQVGPGFMASLRKQGLPLNLLALAIVGMGAALTLASSRWLKIDMASAAGIFAGATTNTPALGAVQEAMKQMPGIDHDRATLPALGYAAAYPMGVVGILVSMLVLRSVFRINAAAEAREFARESQEGREPLKRMSVRVRNPNLGGLKLDEIPGRGELEVGISRIRRAESGEIAVANPETILGDGDVLLAVGTEAHLRQFCLIVGEESEDDLMEAHGLVVFDRFVVTRSDVLGKTLHDLRLTEHFGVMVTRLTRADVEMSAVPDLKLQFGDMLQVVGRQADIAKAGAALGNSVKDLNRTNFIPFTLGIGLGVLLGLLPIHLGSMPIPVRLGLAGGPLIAAIVLSRLGRLGPLVWHMPLNANLAIRELGITLFLACAGLKAGAHFFEVVFTASGLLWLLSGAVITLAPLLVAGWIGRVLMKENFLNLCGLLSGSMTDPPALAFANTINNSDAPSVAYATVYPMTMLARIVAAQLLVVLFAR